MFHIDTQIMLYSKCIIVYVKKVNLCTGGRGGAKGGARNGARDGAKVVIEPHSSHSIANITKNSI